MGGYWRKDVYSAYKASRKHSRDESDINFNEVFSEINKLIDQIRNNLPWKVVEVKRAEADDLMLVLAKEYSKDEQILIFSPDKDMIQAQQWNDNVHQYSSLTHSWVTPKEKNNNMKNWIHEHICLGDPGDEIPKVVAETEFSQNFIEYLKEKNIKELTPYEFKNSELSKKDKMELIMNFDIYKKNRKGESTGVKDIYKDVRFGPKNLEKMITKFGSLDKWLDSHPLYREHYKRNYKLIMAEGIPSNIWNEVIINFKKARTDYNMKAFEDYLNENHLKLILMELPNVFKMNRALTAEDYGW